MEPVNLTGNDLTIEEVINVAKHFAPIEIDQRVIQEALSSTIYIAEKAEDEKVVYGVTTGFGSNVNKIIGKGEPLERRKELYRQLQVNILRSHSCGIGTNFNEQVVRAIMVIRLNTLLKGYSGVQETTIRLLQRFIELGINPVIPEQGSVGSSGDLCPLSHMALPLIGEGYVTYSGTESDILEFFKGKEKPSAELFHKFGNQLNISPVKLSYKEGLALNNGTTVMTAVGVFAIVEAEELLNVGLVTSSLFFEALCVRKDFFGFEEIHTIRNHKGQKDIAEAIRNILIDSNYIDLFARDFEMLDKNNSVEEVIERIMKKFTDDTNGTLKKLLDKKWKPQDSYSVRCTPQVFGASLHAFRHIREVISNELNAAVDNPLIFVQSDKVISGGNFHGQPIGLVMDYLKLAVAEIGNIIERQINKLVDESTNDCLPGFLINDSGLNSGLMIPQYAAASLVSENKVLVHPASADSIPTCANTEDHVSMGTIAARQALQIVENVRKIIAIAILASHHGFTLRKKQLNNFGFSMNQANKTKNFYLKIKEIIPEFKNENALDEDRFIHPDIVAIIKNWTSLLNVAGENLDLGKSIK